MKRLVLAASLALIPLSALPVAAGSFGIDLPRLDFPAPTTDGQTTRADQSPATEATR
ncbi:hypothetical protein GVY41_11600 [Frigidibacter albus]|uniref:Uncharacterized protein n=1 Tax=Frigidibacter albus TaxID=1465486 RepID=A0A6L8VH78_9RHOB|nr:hypothetical protein [Frigidibacter albus]MZQ89737.1 hypothetical protein [Frigidibacter albus]NBE31643.1 hypothetical protein [Frigidibacter albus]GGH54433.1 hypothetical protein GCM10011341_20900 [Frigidibacter albus]